MTFDPLAIWEDAMASAANGLRIKYGLGQTPTAEQIKEWANLTRDFIKGGMDRETAGHAAAKKLFKDYKTHVYASEADYY